MKKISLFFTFMIFGLLQGYSQNIQDYSDTYVMSNTVVQSSNTSSVCTGQRKDISEFPEEKRIELSNLILDYLTSQENPNYDASQDPAYLKYDIVAQHSNYGGDAGAWHRNNEMFFSWHRDYIQGLENWLLATGHPEFVPLPGWNPNQSIPKAFQHAVVQEVLDNPLGDSEELGVIPDGMLNMYEVDNMSCGQFDDMDDFAGFIRAGASNPGGSFTSHNAVHGAIGGAMGKVKTASAAAIFWLFHAHVDELYHCYQTRCQDCEPVFVRATGESENCDFCFDLSLSDNADEITVTLVDQNGNRTNVPWPSWRRCIPYTYLNSGETYTAIIHGTNTSNANCSAEDEISFEFTAPEQPKQRKVENPCLKIIGFPNFPIPDSNLATARRTVTVTNKGARRTFNFKQVQVSTGQSFSIGRNVVIDKDQDYILTIPNQYIAPGQNAVIIEVDGQTMEIDYLIIN